LPYLTEGTCLVEPFAGAGALFLNTSHSKIIVNDINPDLITLYRQLQNTSERFIVEAKKLFTNQNNQKKIYYRNRIRFNKSQDPWERSLLFLYLNRHGYNGLCRYNSQGNYNVPFGAYRAPYFPQKELDHFSRRVKEIAFHCEDYNVLLKRFLRRTTLHKTVFYCDPPYAPLSKTANFTGYAAYGFSLEDQIKLADLARKLARKGATVIMSNHDTPFIREVYCGATLASVSVSRTISCQINTRQKAKEIIAVFKPD
jgi:DNA adenine methylase